MNGCQRGFTVIELMMALAISALLLIAVYRSFTSIDRVRSQITAGSGAHHIVRVVSSRIGRELQSVQFRAGDPDSRFHCSSGSGVRQLGFSSSASTPLASQSGVPSQIMYRLRAAQNDEQGPLVLERSEQSALTLGVPRAMRLVEGVAALSFQFFANGQWSADWDSDQTGALPEAVAMTYERKEGSMTFRTAWPIAAFGG